MAGNRNTRDNWNKRTGTSHSIFTNPEGILRLMRYGLARENLEAARAKGTEGFVWRTRLDNRVRACHEILEDHYFDWSEPPVIDDYGRRGYPGQAWNCRCRAEPFTKGEQPTEEPPHRTAGRIDPRSSHGLFSKPTYWDYRK